MRLAQARFSLSLTLCADAYSAALHYEPSFLFFSSFFKKFFLKYTPNGKILENRPKAWCHLRWRQGNTAWRRWYWRQAPMPLG
jgi:hypothetical protein